MRMKHFIKKTFLVAIALGALTSQLSAQESIFYRDGNATFAMTADGLSKTLVQSVNNRAEPSALVYGTSAFFDRLWVVVKEVGDGQFYPDKIGQGGQVYPGNPHKELFAFKVSSSGSVQYVQITNLFPNVEPIEDTYHAFDRSRWSNDGQDTFVSFVGYDYTPALVDDGNGNLIVDGSLIGFNFANIEHVVRVDVSGSELENPGFSPISYAMTSELHYISTKSSLSGSVHSIGPEDSGDYDWAPDGSKIVVSIPSEGLLFTRDLNGVTNTVLVWGTPQLPKGAKNPRFAPDSSVISFFYGAEIYFINPAGGTPSVAIDLGGKFDSRARWSPNSANLTFKSASTVSPPGNSWIYRATRTGARAKNLTSDLDKTTVKSPVRWVGNNSAP